MDKQNHSERGPIGHDWTEPFGAFIHELSSHDDEIDEQEYDEAEDPFYPTRNHIARFMNEGDKINEPVEAL